MMTEGMMKFLTSCRSFARVIRANWLQLTDDERRDLFLIATQIATQARHDLSPRSDVREGY